MVVKENWKEGVKKIRCVRFRVPQLNRLSVDRFYRGEVRGMCTIGKWGAGNAGSKSFYWLIFGGVVLRGLGGQQMSYVPIVL